MAVEKQIIKHQRILPQEEIKLCEQQNSFFWAAMNDNHLEVKIHCGLNHFGLLPLQWWRTAVTSCIWKVRPGKLFKMGQHI